MPRWVLALVFLAGIGLIYAGYRVAAPVQRPNVVFLLLDTLRADRVGGQRNGTPITPFLHEFSKGGATFSHAISPSSWTKPTLASLFTALYPETHKVRFSADPTSGEHTSDVLADAIETLPEYLRDAGYDNWGIQTNENGNTTYGFAQGFGEDRYAFHEFIPGKEVTSLAIDTLPRMKPPFFLFAQYVDPHSPYSPAPEYREIFGPQPEITQEDAQHINDDKAFSAYFQDDTDFWLGRTTERKFPPLSDAGKEAIRYRYDAECRQLDDQVARLVRTIEGQFPNTIFVIVSDHGDEFWERGTLGHSHQVYEELIHVPLIVRGPGIPAGEVSQPVSTMGIWPTLAKTLGLPARPQWQVPDLFAQAATPAPVYSWTQGSYNDGKVNVSAMVDGDMKLMNSPIDPKIPDPTHAETQLFDLAKDPGENQNLYPRRLEDDLTLLAKLERHRETATKAGETVTASTTPISAEQMSQLEQLGYARKEDAPAVPATPPAAAQRNEQLESLGYLGNDTPKPAPQPSTSSAAPASKPNVLLVVIDTLRADRVAATRNGVPVMPNLHAFAQQSTWYPNAIAQASWTKPSVTSILTGLYTQTHRVQFGVQKPWVEGQEMTVQGLAPEKLTILGFLKQHGYGTAAIQTNVHMQAMYGFGAGCDDYHYARWASATEVTDQALARAAQLPQPFALYAHYFDPHADFAPPEPHRSAFGPLPALTAQEQELLTDDYHQKYYLQKAKHDMGLTPTGPTAEFSEQGREHVRQLYDGECHYTDEQLHRLLTEVRAKWPNTIVVITSDHGEEFWEHGGLGHAKTVYQEVINVPYIISIPGAPPRIVETPVENIDIAPTLAAQLGLPPLDHWQGRNVLAEQLAPRPVYSETRGSFPEAMLHREAIISANEKLIRDERDKTLALFDLTADPREANNLAPTAPEKASALGQLLDQHIADAKANPLAAIAPPIFNLEGGPASTENREALEAIGYLGAPANTGELPSQP